MALVVVIAFGLIIVLLGMGTWVGLAIGASGIITLTFLAKMPGLMGSIIYNTLADYVMAAIPLFIFMGEIMTQGGLSERLYDGVSKWTRIVPGGLTHSNIGSCAIFAAISGSSIATAATISTVAYPELAKRGYDSRIVAGSLAAGGGLGPLIPPSMGTILYGAFVGESVGKLFIGAIFPGIMIAIMFMIYIYIRFLLRPSLGPKPEPITLGYFWDALRAWKSIWPVTLLILIIFGGIYGGFMTPTEAAAVSSFVALCIVLAFRRLSFDILKSAALRALEVTAMCFLIIVSAKILAVALAMLMIPKQLCAMAGASGLPPLAIWGILCLMYLILGCFMDAISLQFLTLAVAYPLMMSLGFDSVWFGVILVITLEAGFLTPPMGINLFVIQGVTKLPFWEVVKGSIPFFFVMLVAIVVVTAFPQMVTWLVATMR